MLHTFPARQSDPHGVSGARGQRRIDLAVDIAAVADVLHLAILQAGGQCIFDYLARVNGGDVLVAWFRDCICRGAG